MPPPRNSSRQLTLSNMIHNAMPYAIVFGVVWLMFGAKKRANSRDNENRGEDAASSAAEAALELPPAALLFTFLFAQVRERVRVPRRGVRWSVLHKLFS